MTDFDIGNFFSTTRFSHEKAESVRMHEQSGNAARNILENLFLFSGSLSPDGFLLDLKGEIFKDASIEPELLVGHKFSETVFWQSLSHNAEQLNKAVSEAAQGKNTVTEIEFRVTAKNQLFVELNLLPQLDDAQQVESIFFCAKDITGYRREIDFYKDRNEQFIYAAENAEIGLWFWDLKENAIHSTPKFNEFFGLAPNELLDWDYFLQTVHPGDRERIEAEWTEATRTGENFDSEFRVDEGGNPHWLATRGKTYFDEDGIPISMMGVMRRVTDRKLADRELAKIYAREKKARDDAEEANRAKDYFLAIVSHELRSPLNAILGWAKILLTKDVDETILRSALETIERSAKAQAKLIDDLVDVSRVTSGKLRLEMRPINLFTVVQSAYNAQKPAAENKGIKFDFNFNAEDAQIFGDSGRIQQVFMNLLTNAIKFTPENGSITIDLKADAKNVEVSVSDSGQGISSEFLPHIFQQFAQASASQTRDKSGLGLGLAIVKTLVDKHDGTIRAESAGIGRGAKFIVDFPVHVSTGGGQKKADVESPECESQPLEGVRILLLEDDTDSREVLTVFLEQCGASVCATGSAVEALQILASSTAPDVIVSDLAMPGEDGFAFLHKVRNLPGEKAGIPAMALSAFASNENKERALSIGFHKYHTKPFEPDEMVKEILEIIKTGK